MQRAGCDQEVIEAAQHQQQGHGEDHAGHPFDELVRRPEARQVGKRHGHVHHHPECALGKQEAGARQKPADHRDTECIARSRWP